MSKVKKVVLRKKFLEIRKKINREKELTSSLNEKVLNFFTKSKNNIIAGYISVNNEIDIFNSLKRIVINNLVCLPEIVEGNRKLNFNKWDLCSEMIIGSYKIPIPKKKELVIPNYVIVPLVAFDKKKK